MAIFLGLFAPNTNVKETLLENESVCEVYESPGTFFSLSYWVKTLLASAIHLFRRRMFKCYLIPRTKSGFLFCI